MITLDPATIVIGQGEIVTVILIILLVLVVLKLLDRL